MPDQNQDNLQKLYTNAKNDGYDLPDYEQFKKDMSNPENLKKLHTNLSNAGYELPDFGKFSSDMGFSVKKKETTSSVPKLSKSLDKNFISSSTLPEETPEKPIDLKQFLTQRQGSLVRGDIANQPNVPKQQANAPIVAPIKPSERPAIKQEVAQSQEKTKNAALRNTAILKLQEKGQDITDDNLKKEQETLNNQIKNDDVALTFDENNMPVYGRRPAWHEEIGRSLGNTLNKVHDLFDLATAGFDNKKRAEVQEEINQRKQAEAKMNGWDVLLGATSNFDTSPYALASKANAALMQQDAYNKKIPLASPNLPNQIAGSISGGITDIAPYLLGGEAGILGKAVVAASEAFPSGFEQMYNKYKNDIKTENPNITDEQAQEMAAAKAAKNIWRELPDAGLNYMLMGKIGMNLPTEVPAAKNIINAIKDIAGQATIMGGKGIVAEGLKAGIEALQGEAPTSKELVDRLSRKFGNFFLMESLFKGLPLLAKEGGKAVVNTPKYVLSAIKNYAALPEVRPFVDEILQDNPNKEKITEELDKWNEDKKPLEGLVDEEKMPSVVGLQQKINGLNEKIKQVPEALKPQIQAQIDETNKQIDDILKSNKPSIEFEKDDKGNPLVNKTEVDEQQKATEQKPIESPEQIASKEETGVVGEPAKVSEENKKERADNANLMRDVLDEFSIDKDGGALTLLEKDNIHGSINDYEEGKISGEDLKKSFIENGVSEDYLSKKMVENGMAKNLELPTSIEQTKPIEQPTVLKTKEPSGEKTKETEQTTIEPPKDAGKVKAVKLNGTEIVEHSEDVATADGKENGINPTDLTERGKKEAENLGEYIADNGKTKIVSSEVERAKQTAKIAADAANKKLGINNDTPMADANGIKPESNPVLNTLNIGSDEGKPEGTFKEKEYFDGTYLPEGAESPKEFTDRMEQAYKYVNELPKDVQVIAHSKVIRAMKALSETDGKWTDETTKKFIQLGEQEKKQQPTDEGDENVVGISKAETKKQREERGLEDIPDADRVKLKTLFDEGKKAVDDGDIDARELAKQLKKNPRPLSAKEVNALLYDRKKIRDEYQNVITKTEEAIKSGDSLAETELRERAKNLDEALLNNEIASRNVGRENSLALLAFKGMLKDDYSFAVQKAKATLANNGEDLPASIIEKFKKWADELEKAQAKLKEYEEKTQRLEAENEILRIKEETKAKRTKTEKKADLKKEREDIINQLRGIAKSQMGKLSANPIPVEMIPVLAKLVRNLVEDGIVELEDVVKKVHESLSEFVEGLTERDVRDAISGYGKVRQLSKNEIEKQIREIKRQGRLVSALEDVEKGERPKRSGLNREEESPRVKELKKALNEEMKKQGITLDKKEIDPEKEFKTKLEAYKKRLQTQLEDYENRIKNKDFAIKERKPIELDKQGLELKAKVEEIKKKFDAERKRIENENKPKLEKRLNLLTQWRRFVLLSNIPTFGKLATAVTYRSATSFAEEIIAQAMKHLPYIKRIVAKAEREGKPFDFKREVDALKELVSKKTLSEMKKAVMTGSTELDSLYSDKPAEPAEWYGFFGRLHKAMKTPAHRAEFLRSYDILSKNAAENGIDVSDPKAQFELGVKAYEEANRAIFMNENIATNSYQALVKTLEQGGDKGKVGAATLRVLLPIVKVPTNYVAEATSYAIGLPKALFAMRKGIENLTPEQSDYVIRALKKQGIGAAVIALGYFNPNNVGGYYTGKRLDDDLKAGDIEVLGVKMPHWMTHSPLLEMLQIGATIRRTRDAYDAENKENGTVSGIYNSGKGLISQVPFLSEPTEIAKGLKNANSASDFAGKLTKDMILPPDLQRIAKQTDTDELGNPIKRESKGFLQEIQSGIPVLRKSLEKAE
jgi:broad specificity phosphatase PhoE